MKFILLIDSIQSSVDTINLVSGIVNNIDKKLHNTQLDVYIINNGACVDSDTDLLLKILGKEKQRCPIFIDSMVAYYYPELMNLQSSIVIINRDNNLGINEQIVISHGARVIYENENNEDIINDLSVIDYSKFIATNEYIESLAKLFYNEHCRFPITLLPRNAQQDCKNVDELLEKYEKRLSYADYITWVCSIDYNVRFDDIEISSLCQNNAVHLLSDPRLHKASHPILFNKNV